MVFLSVCKRLFFTEFLFAVYAAPVAQYVHAGKVAVTFVRKKCDCKTEFFRGAHAALGGKIYQHTAVFLFKVAHIRGNEPRA